MARTVGKMSEIRNMLVSSHFVWKISGIKSILRKEGDACQSPPHMCRNSVWTLKITRRDGYAEININRRAKSPNQEHILQLILIKKNSNCDDSLIYNLECGANERNWNISAIREINFLDDERNFSLEITCYPYSECEKRAPRYPGSLGGDLQELLISGEDSDVTIKVKDRVFNVHKNILRARSPVFFSMFEYDTAEKLNRIFDIPDCEPEAFERFLEYIYSGEPKDLSKNSVSSLYYIADKFKVLGAKAECVNILSRSLSMDTFWDIATLALRHGDSELLESVGQFFVDNSEEITATDRWLTFLKENSVDADYFSKQLLVHKVNHVEKRNLLQWLIELLFNNLVSILKAFKIQVLAYLILYYLAIY